jgi:hypothetical protein
MGVALSVALVTAGSGLFFAAESQQPTDAAGLLLGYGPLGLVVLGFITGWIVPGSVVKKKDAEIERLQGLFESQVFPMAQTYASTMAQATTVMHDVTDEIRELRRSATERR